MPPPINALPDLISRKFGSKVKLLERRGPEVLIRVRGVGTSWIPRQRLYDRSTARHLFLTSREARAAKVKDQIEALSRKSLEAIQSKVDELGLVGVRAKPVLNKNGNYIAIDFAFKGTVVRIKKYSWLHEIKSARDFWTRYAAIKRFGRALPLLYTDREWRELVEKRTHGAFTSDFYRPPGTQANGPVQRLVCTRCETEFFRPRPFNKANFTWRCSVCFPRNAKRSSKQGVKWLDDISRRFKIKIQHAGNKGEVKVVLENGTSTYVDGFYRGIVFEFHGGRFHGDPTLFYPDEKPNPYAAATAYSLLARTMKRERSLIQSGFKLVRIWDRDFYSEERYNQWLLYNRPRLEAFIAQSKSCR